MTIKRWVAGAQTVTDVWTLTLTGTVTSQNYTITIGGTTLYYAADGSATVASILAALAALWKSTAPLPPAPFQELSVVVTTTSITATQKVSGRPTVIAFTTDGGSSPVATNTVAATGPNFFDNVANWSTGTAPANGDTLVFDSGNVPCKYNVNTSLTTVVVNVYPGYSGQIGLPDRNTDGNAYHEYRTTSLTLDGGTLLVNSPTISLCRVNFGSTLATVRVLNTGQRIDPNVPVVLLTGGAASSELDVVKGDVATAFFAGESANFPTIKMSFANQQQSDARLTCGVGCSATTITKTGGILDLFHSATTLTQDVNSGVTTIYDAVALTTWNVNGGVANFNSTGTVATINVRNDGVLTADSDPRAKTVTNAINVYGPNAKVKDNGKTINSGVLTVATTGVPTGNIEHGLTNSSIVLT